MSDYGKMTDEQLICNLRAGEQEITDYVMDKYKFLVKKKAKEMYLLGGENDDLIQEGMIGLFKAVRDYDSEQGKAFASVWDLFIYRTVSFKHLELPTIYPGSNLGVARSLKKT